MRRTTLRRLGVIAALGGVAVLYAQPWLVMHDLQQAVDARDEPAIERMVDFPALRASVKSELNASVARRVGEDDRNPLSALARGLAGAVIGPAVEAFVTPAGLATLLAGERPAANGTAAKTAPAPEPAPAGPSAAKRHGSRAGYESPGVFVVERWKSETPDERIGLVFTRAGLSWRLTGLRLAPAVR